MTTFVVPSGQYPLILWASKLMRKKKPFKYGSQPRIQRGYLVGSSAGKATGVGHCGGQLQGGWEQEHGHAGAQADSAIPMS